MYKQVGLGAACVPFTSWSDPLCLYELLAGGYAPSQTESPNTSVNPLITQAYVYGSTPVVPAEAYDSGVAPGGGSTAQSATDTIAGILSGSQLNAINAATAAAAAQAAANLPPDCVLNPASLACWMAKNTAMLWIAGLTVAAIFIMQGRR